MRAFAASDDGDENDADDCVDDWGDADDDWLDADDAARRCRSSLHVLWLDLDVKLVARARAFC